MVCCGVWVGVSFRGKIRFCCFPLTVEKLLCYGYESFILLFFNIWKKTLFRKRAKTLKMFYFVPKWIRRSEYKRLEMYCVLVFLPHTKLFLWFVVYFLWKIIIGQKYSVGLFSMQRISPFRCVTVVSFPIISLSSLYSSLIQCVWTLLFYFSYCVLMKTA